MRKFFDHYQDPAAMTRSILDWLAVPSFDSQISLSFSANNTLEPAASEALLKSEKAQQIVALEFAEVHLTAQQLSDLLGLPGLVDLRIWGGASADWAGPEYVWPTLGLEHIEVLTASADAQRLRVLELNRHDFDQVIGLQLRQALPSCELLVLEGKQY